MIGRLRKLVLLRRAIRWANAIRAEVGLGPIKALPKGYKKSCSQCPLALGLGDGGSFYAEVDGTGALIMKYIGPDSIETRPRIYRYLPSHVHAFVVAFDRGRYPELVR